MVPIIVDRLEEILRSYCSKFILPDTSEKANTTLKLMQLNFLNKNICHLGYGINEELRKLKSEGKVTDESISKFKRDVRNFLATLCQHVAEKSPLQSYFARCTRALNPINMGETPKSCSNLFDRMLKKLVEYKKILPNIADLAKQE